MMWVLLVTAGLLEVIGVMGMAMVSKEKSRIAWVLLIGGFALSFFCLSVAMQSIPLGTAYGVWTGIGTVGSTTVGMIFYKEPRDTRRLFFIFLIILSVIGLKLVS